MPLALYHVLWMTNPAGGAWNTLTSNVSSTGGVMQVTDASAAGGYAGRYYRVQMPP